MLLNPVYQVLARCCIVAFATILMLLNPVYQVLTRCYIVAFFVFFCFLRHLLLFCRRLRFNTRFQADWACHCEQIRVSNYIGPLPWNEGCPQPPAVPSVISGRSGG